MGVGVREGRLADGNGNRSMRQGVKSWKEPPPCQTAVMRDGPEIVWLHVHHRGRERDEDGESKRVGVKVNVERASLNLDPSVYSLD